MSTVTKLLMKPNGAPSLARWQ